MASATNKNSKARKAAGSKTASAPPSARAKTAPRAARPAKGRKAAKGRAASGDAERSAPPMAEVDADVLEFIEAIDRFKKQHNRPFPSWSEVLMVLRDLGYRRTGR